MYDYIKRIYDYHPAIGQRVRHMVTLRDGVICREDAGQANYVQVKFDGDKHKLPCHPEELENLK